MDKWPDSQGISGPIPRGKDRSQRIEFPSGIRYILLETRHGKRDTLSSGIRTTFPLGNILLESGIWEIRYKEFFKVLQKKRLFLYITNKIQIKVVSQSEQTNQIVMGTIY